MLLRLLFRRWWLVAVVFAAQQVVLFAPGPGPLYAVRVLLSLAFAGLVVYALMRFGLVTTSVLLFVWSVLGRFPLTTNLTAWYAPTAVLAMLSVVAIAVYGFRTTLAGRPLWRDELQRE
jgi:hypothetical protein